MRRWIRRAGLLVVAHAVPVALLIAPALAGERERGGLSTGVLERVLGDFERVTEGRQKGLLSVRLAGGGRLLTHGPDLRSKVRAADHGTTIGPGDPERDPVCASDNYQHIVYVRASNAPDNYASAVTEIRASTRRANAVLNEESLESGSKTADYKVLCTTAGDVRVDPLVDPGAPHRRGQPVVLQRGKQGQGCGVQRP